MHAVCLLFSGRRGLEDQEVRHSVLRIPEVSRKLKQAQYLLDSLSEENNHRDLISYILSPDDDFNSQQTLKSLVSAVVQMGLFDRYVKYRHRPTFLVGRINGCSAIKVCADKQSFEDFIFESEYISETVNIATLVPQKTKLTGLVLEEYGVYKWNAAGEYLDVETDTKEAAKIIEDLSVDHDLHQCIHVGPCFDFRIQEFEKKGLDISSMNSIDLDPILNSFWKSA